MRTARSSGQTRTTRRNTSQSSAQLKLLAPSTATNSSTRRYGSRTHVGSANSSARSRARLRRSMAADSTASFASDLSSFLSRCALAHSRCASLSSYSCCRRRRNRSVFSSLRVAFGLPTVSQTTVSRVLRQARPAPRLGVSATPLACNRKGVFSVNYFWIRLYRRNVPSTRVLPVAGFFLPRP